MIQARLRYDKKTKKHHIELHRRGKLVEDLSVKEAGELIERLVLHMSMCFYDAGGR